MKLSQALKDWPEKKEYPEVMERHDIHSVDSHNTALTSCDREVDREALAKVCHENSGSVRMFSKCWDSLCEGDKNVFRKEADAIISTMPTWLKRSEDK